MPAIKLQDCVYDDPKIALCAKELRLSHERLIVKLGRLWSYVTRLGDALVGTDEIAHIVGRHPDKVAQALLRHSIASGMDEDGGLLDLDPMREWYGDYEWYVEQRESAPNGGRKRAATAKRQSGRFAARDWQTDINAALSASDGEAHINEIADALNTRPNRVRPHLEEMVGDGLIDALGGGLYALVEPAAPAAEGDTPTAGTSGAPAATTSGSVPTVPAVTSGNEPLVPAATSGNHQRQTSGTSAIPTPIPTPTPPNGGGPEAQTSPTPLLFPDEQIDGHVVTSTQPPKQRRKSRTTTKPKAKPSPSPGYQAFIDEFTRLFQQHRGGAKPSWGTKEGAMVKTCLKRTDGDVEIALARARRMFAIAPKFPAENPDLATLVGHWDKFAPETKPDPTIGQGRAASYEEFTRNGKVEDF